jgi:hypothetical protein
MKILPLTFNDIDQVRKFFDSDLALTNYFLNEDESRYQMFGCFNDDLYSIVGTVDSITTPAWILSRNYSCGPIDITISILEKIISLKETQSIFQFFTLCDDEEFKNLQQSLSRYQPYLEHEVLPNSLTGFESIDHDVMEYKTYPEPLKIYTWVLKNDCRVI